ncbi:adiponectin receptor protein 1 [Eremomyces bilateralis CBS 781.70]|uniref:Adiponectin receptor protein 1 n=1 Tax=Eremomyces bilateralis CBS 781.70 TaxID=1392243 RepID=A0A6G1GAZ7_9PEZI|nr:adiponectin receptor protein 1 [Eremomyces bilateralis CBS 781.70]KAF1815162.1 adiponectin receptor protein 1 [Eremomyces bilateralis CBS 781.70]
MTIACTSAVVVESYEEPAFGTSSALDAPRPRARRRRHSSYHPMPFGIEPDNVQVLIDRFLAELSRRLDLLECYGQLQLDSSIERAYSTLVTVRDACTATMDDSRRQARILVETLESTYHERYNEALATKETLEAKAQEGVHLLEGLLAEFESRAYAVRNAGFSMVNQDRVGEAWRHVDSTMQSARETVDEGIAKAWRAKEHLQGSIEAAVERALTLARSHGHITYSDLPEPWRVNPHIHGGYRFHSKVLECVRSTLSFHNELVNIWSHFIGFFLVATVALYFYPLSKAFPHSTWSDVAVASMFFLAATKCLICSTIYHTFNCISSHKLLARFACVDYTGISLLVAASILTSEYTAFYCEPVARWSYMLSTAVLGLAGTILPWHPTFNRNELAWVRVLFYSSLACTGFFPAIHIALTRGARWALYFYGPLSTSLAAYLAGAILYAAKIPERFWPGTFDYLGASHNIWHIAVVCGIMAHYAAMVGFFEKAFQRVQDGTCSSF